MSNHQPNSKWSLYSQINYLNTQTVLIYLMKNHFSLLKLSLIQSTHNCIFFQRVWDCLKFIEMMKFEQSLKKWTQLVLIHQQLCHFVIKDTYLQHFLVDPYGKLYSRRLNFKMPACFFKFKSHLRAEFLLNLLYTVEIIYVTNYPEI